MNTKDSPQESDTTSELIRRFDNNCDGMIRKLYDQYCAIEKACDDTLEQHDNLLDQIFRRVPARKSATTIFGEVAFNDVSVRAARARKLTPPSHQIGENSVILKACGSQLKSLEDLEFKAESLQHQMREVEQVIFNRCPSNSREAIAKLRFIVALLLDGSDLDIQRLAFQVDECTTVIERST